MSKEKIIKEIQKEIEEVPEPVLEDILKLLKEYKNYSSDSIRLSRNLQKILEEDNALLQKLAE
ncbi:MAG: hypothetical protein K9J27_09715 [Bacteroidales bacterium]|nr:hypothetical protein [Bacteroidales bacterium]MCF8334368.1 hypothetical protein [Bacteroidales bacterium]